MGGFHRAELGLGVGKQVGFRWVVRGARGKGGRIKERRKNRDGRGGPVEPGEGAFVHLASCIFFFFG